MKKNNRMSIKSVNRMLIFAVAIISLAVVAFAMVSVVNTDYMAQYVEDTYNNAYTLSINVMKLRTVLSNARETMYDVTENTTSMKTRNGLTELYQNRKDRGGPVEVVLSLMAPEQSEQARNNIVRLQTLNDQIIAMSFAGEKEGARQLLEEEAEPYYDNLDAMFEEMIGQGTVAIEYYVEQSYLLNEDTNQTMYVLVVVVIALSLFTSIFCARTISARNQEIYQREMLFNVIMENVDDVFIIYEYNTGEIQFVSQNIDRIYGIHVEQGMDNYEIVREYMSEDVYQQMRHAYDMGSMTEVLELEYEFINQQTGLELLLRTRLYPYYDGTQKHLQLVSVTQDITHDRMAQDSLIDALKEAEYANAAKRDFLSRASHDLKTPINAIIGMKAIAEISADDKQKVLDCMDKIDVAAKHLLSLVDEVLDMSTLETGKLKLEVGPFDLQKMVDDVASIIYSRAQEKKLHFHVVKDSIMQEKLIGDETRIRQILLNFLTNAVKFTGEEGNITFVIRQHDESEDAVFTRFVVRDDGIGIAQDFLDKVFLPFEQEQKPEVTKHRGAGLGMAISQSLAKQMGGDITFTSKEGEGSEFVFDVKLQEQQPNLPQEGNRDIHSFDFSGKRMLIVEDNEINMEIADELMRTVGFETELAVNGEQGVSMYKSRPRDYYDVILMDVHMPVMDGHAAAREIRGLEKQDAQSIPIVAMTANASHESINESISSGMDAHIAKPFDPAEVFAVLEKLIGKRE